VDDNIRLRNTKQQSKVMKMKELLAIEKLHKARYEIELALSLIENGQLRESKKHIDEVKDEAIGAIHLVNAEIDLLEGGE